MTRIETTTSTRSRNEVPENLIRREEFKAIKERHQTRDNESIINEITADQGEQKYVYIDWKQ